jgi:hypothetical protein
MTMDADLKKLERRAFLTFFQDGLWDIFIGLFVLGWGLSMLMDTDYLIGVWFLAFWFIALGLKRWLTYPRIGYARLGQQKTRVVSRLVIILAVVALAGALMAVLVSSGSRPQWLMDYFPMLFSGMLALIVAGIAVWLGAYRFVLHAAFILIAGAVHQWLGVKWPHTFIAAGALSIIIGLYVLFRFLRRYPRASQEEIDAGR